jgi:hypothetical protein
MGEHRCPAPGCPVQVPDEFFACSRHWYSLPKQLRDELWHAYAGGRGVGKPRHRAALEACIAFLEGKAAA